MLHQALSEQAERCGGSNSRKGEGSFYAQAKLEKMLVRPTTRDHTLQKGDLVSGCYSPD